MRQMPDPSRWSLHRQIAAAVLLILAIYVGGAATIGFILVNGWLIDPLPPLVRVALIPAIVTVVFLARKVLSARRLGSD